MYWIIFCLLSSLQRAAFSEVNRIYKLDPIKLNFLHACFASALILPVIPLVEIPQDITFYSTAFISGIILSFGCFKQLDLASRFNGRVASMYIPIEMLVAVIVWGVVSPASVLWLIGHPIRMISILLAMISIVAAFSFLKRSPLGWSNFLHITPVGALYGLNAVMMKLGIGEHDAFSSILYVFINYVVMMVAMYALLRRERTALSDLNFSKTFIPGLLTGALSTGAFICFVVGVSLSSSPAYPTIISMLVPVWILAYHRLSGISDESSPLAGTLLLLSVAAFFILIQN